MRAAGGGVEHPVASVIADEVLSLPLNKKAVRACRRALRSLLVDDTVQLSHGASRRA